MRLLLTVVRCEGITALVATHDEALMDLADEVLRLEDGHIVDRRCPAAVLPGTRPRHRCAAAAQL
jgi:putative ABC transport system ATP-binding protein